jgi:hypothetical protein
LKKLQLFFMRREVPARPTIIIKEMSNSQVKLKRQVDKLKSDE